MATDISNDEMITKAILDRILHYSYLFNINGPSYRIKDKLNPKKLRTLNCNNWSNYLDFYTCQGY